MKHILVTLPTTIYGATFLAIVTAFYGNVSLPAAEPATNIEFFETNIRPVLARACYECHSAAVAEPKGGLRLDSRDGARRGGESGPAVVPGNLEKSLLIKAIRHETVEMPPGKKLPAEVIADFARWIELGAPDPRDRPPTVAEAAEQSWKAVLEERRGWWSLQPLRDVQPPQVDDPNWSQNPIDRFIWARLHEAGLQPAPAATQEILQRRLSFVLTGLPPRGEEVEAFVSSFSPSLNPSISRSPANERETESRREGGNVYESLVDRLLQSPHFGERFARLWMDVIRYGDTFGYEWDNPVKGAWRYRDYLIRAFNQDVGFDQLVREQIAGDLLDRPRIDQSLALNESLIGPLFYHLGEHRHEDSLQINGVHQEMLNNKIDAFSKAFLATTVACARCHDHKLDAVAQRDYYALAAVFMTPRWTTRAIDTADRNAAAIERLKSLRGEIRAALATYWRSAAADFPTEIQAAFCQRENDSSATRKRAVLWQTAVDKPTQDGKQPALENIVHPLVRLRNLAQDTVVSPQWMAWSNEWRTEHDRRTAENASKFNVVTDFRDPALPAGWTTEGEGMFHGYVRDGEPLVALEGTSIVDRLLPCGYHTHALSSKLPGLLRTPRLQDLKAASLSVAMAGGNWAGHLTVVNNAFQCERLVFVDRPQPAWQRLDTFLKRADLNIRTEFTTCDLNSNFPPRTGKAKSGEITLAPRDNGEGKRSWFSVTGIVTHDEPAAPQDTLARFATLYQENAPKTVEQAWNRIGRWFASAVDRWAAGNADASDVELVNWLLENELLPNRCEQDAALATLVEEYRRVECTIQPPRTVMSMDERSVAATPYPLSIRGDIDQLGELVPHDFLQVFASKNSVAASPGSGRRELAEFLVSPDHPLTTRVYVNRVWTWLFGNGLVGTPDDFGHLGQLPSHPELLDYLAREFIADGWSTKRLVRRIVMSRTFRQSGQASSRARDIDGGNRLLHHYPTRRLEAEAVRDTMLAVSGRLDATLYGPPIDPYRAKEDEAKRLFTGPIDGNGRRSIYLKMTIMEPPKFLAVFNQPSPKIPTGKRDVTNVPTQALTLLNDPFVHGQAEYWGAALMRQPHRTLEERLRAMFVRALGRAPNDRELALWTTAAREFGDSGEVKKLAVTDEALLTNAQVWTRVAHALFNAKEFLYYR